MWLILAEFCDPMHYSSIAYYNRNQIPGYKATAATTPPMVEADYNILIHTQPLITLMGDCVFQFVKVKFTVIVYNISSIAAPSLHP